MNVIKSVALVFLLFGTWSTPAQETQYLKEATVSFEFVSKKVKGSVKGFESNSQIIWGDIEKSQFSGSVAVTTLDTNNGLRNWSLKNRKYFDEDKHPKIHFKSDTVQKDENGFVVKGQLTLKGVSKAIAIAFTREGESLIGRTSLYTSDFGIKIKKKREDNLVTIKMVFKVGEKSN